MAPVKVFRRQRTAGRLSKAWYFRVSVKGRQKRISTGHSDRRKAEAFARDYVEELRSKKSARQIVAHFAEALSEVEPVPLAEAWDLFVSLPTRRKLAPMTIANRKFRWDAFLSWVSAKHPSVRSLNDVTYTIAVEYVGQVYARDLSNRSKNAYRDTVKLVFRALKRHSGLLEVVWEDTPRLENDYQEREAFTPAELRLIGQQGDDWCYPLFALAIHTGLREGDICTLKWQEVDLARGWITRVQNKTGNEVRIPLFTALSAYLGALPQTSECVLPEHAQCYLKNPWDVSERVKGFLHGLGIRTTRSVPGRKRRLSIKDLHSCRHTFVYLAEQHGVPLSIIQSIVGHINHRMTLRYLDHATDEAKVLGISRLPNYLGLPESGASTMLDPRLTAISDEDLLRECQRRELV